MKRAALALGLLLAAVELAAACSEQVPLAPMNALCEFDEQCSKGLACKCLRRRNPDDQGPDEILEFGRCVNPLSYTCPRDGGVADTAFDAPPAVDTAPEVAADGEEVAVDAADGG